MVSATDLVFAYHGSGFQLNVPRIEVAAGEKVAIIGPSGSGKTTLLHLFAGIREPQSGKISICGKDVVHLTAAARRHFRLTSVGLVFQEFELLEYLSVLDNILIACRIGSPLKITAQRREAATRLAAQVGLTSDKLRRLPQQLSQGERQRVAICRALLHDPPLLLADEPTGNLDPANKRRILDLLIEHAVSRRATLVAATHDHQLLGAFDRVLEMEKLTT
jgi:ABC-type lipoprotein export system ATPase subunit